MIAERRRTLTVSRLFQARAIPSISTGLADFPGVMAGQRGTAPAFEAAHAAGIHSAGQDMDARARHATR